MQYTKKAELHCHTNIFRLFNTSFLYESVMTPEIIIQRALELDISILAITDHNSMDGYKKGQKIISERNLPILLIPAMELSTRNGHVLAYGIQSEIEKDLSLKETLFEIHRQGGIAIAAHPFFGEFGVRDGLSRYDFDGAEGYNTMTWGRALLQAKTEIKKLGLPAIAGSDAHHPCVMGTGTALFRESVNSEKDFIQAVKQNDFSTKEIRPNIVKMIEEHVWGTVKILF